MLEPAKRGRPPNVSPSMATMTVTLDKVTIEFMRQLALQETGALNLSGGIRIAARLLANQAAKIAR